MKNIKLTKETDLETPSMWPIILTPVVIAIGLWFGSLLASA